MNSTACYFPDDLLENYAMGKLSDHESGPLEEHLLVCTSCQKRIEELDEYVRILQAALAESERTPPATPLRRLPLRALLAPPAAALWRWENALPVTID